jgi:hypothetical protein
MLNFFSELAIPIWSSPYKTTTSFSAVAVLLDNGNLVIRDQINNSRVNWQSFDNPTNILLGGRLGFNTITRKNVTLVSYSGYRSTYTLAFDATRRRGFTIQQNSDGPVFAGTFPRWMDIGKDGEYAITFHDAYTYIQLDKSGIIRFTKRGECNSILWSSPQGACYFGSDWGPDSLCTTSCSCKCPAGFYSDSYYYCWRMVRLSCEGESFVPQPKDTFSPIDGIYVYPRNALPSETMNMSQCESSCLKNCSCTAFAYYNTSCLLWFGKLQNTIVLDSGSSGNRIYIRIRTQQELQNVGFSFQKKVALISVVGVLGLIVLGLFCLWRCRRKIFDAGTINDHGSLMIFSFVEIQNSTKNFSEKLGEGGFGCVFKALLPMPGCTIAAVKKLKDLRQEEKQFRAEVQSIGLIQHINIVRLLGFCAEYSRKFLVYEYMSNGSLSNHLFSKRSSKLSWELRYSIALGIARGLAYLHEGCKDCIVHCDIKPDNILLDTEFCPKIADFGMAKLLCRDYSRVLTTMRGTIGYLAPEWISGVPITHKADVYSYGMVLLEIISGRRNSERIKEGKFTYFPIYAAVKVNEGDVMCLLDSNLEGNADAEQLNRACRVACWCIQDAEDHRPMMGQIVRMLEGVLDVKVPPIPRSLQNYVGMEHSISADLNIISEVSD